MNHVKQKVYIVVSYPLNSRECRILKVFGNKEAADRFFKRNVVKLSKETLHVVKKSVEGSSVCYKYTEFDAVTIHRGNKNGSRKI